MCRRSWVSHADDDGATVIVALDFDAAGRPDLRDLGRVHLVEGGGEVDVVWGLGAATDALPGFALLRIRFHRPVRTALDVVVFLPPEDAPATVRLLRSATGFLLCPDGVESGRSVVVPAPSRNDEIERGLDALAEGRLRREAGAP